MKKIILVLGTVVTLMSLAACSIGNQETGKNASGKKEIVITSWDTAADALKECATEYMKKHKDIKITVQPSDAQLQKVTPNLISGKGAPDIIHTQARDFSGVLAKFPDQFLDITDKVADIKGDFTDAAWDSTYANDGSIHAMPWDIGPTAIYYRTDYFEKAGIDPASIKTWDDFIAAGKKFKQALPDVMFTSDGSPTDYDHYQIFLNQLGGSFIKDGKIDMESPASIQAFEMIQKMFKAGIMETDEGDINSFTNGKLGCIINPVWFAGHIESKVADEAGKWKVIAMPSFEEGGNTHANLGGGTLAITTQSKNPDEALDFLKYCLTTTKGQDVMMSKGLFPSYTPYYETAEFKKENEYFGMPLNAFFGELTTDVPEIEYGTIMPDTYTPLGNACADIKNGKDVKKTAADCADKISEATKVEINKY